MSKFKTQKQHSDKLSNRITLDYNTTRPSKKILILGSQNSGKTTFKNCLLGRFGGVTKLSESVMAFVFKCIIYSYEMMKENSLIINRFHGLEETIRKSIKERKINENLAEFMKFIRIQHEDFLEFTSNHIRYLNNIEYFFTDEFIDRLQHGKEFSIQDFIRIKIPKSNSAICEFSIEYFGRNLLVDPSGMRGEPRKWIHQFEYVANQVIYFISLSDYILHDQINNVNCLEMAIWSFREILRLGMCNTFLYFTKVDQFMKLLEKFPFSNYFENYSGGNDVQEILSFLVENQIGLYEQDHLNRYNFTIGNETIQVMIRTINLLDEQQVMMEFSNIVDLESRTVV